MSLAGALRSATTSTIKQAVNNSTTKVRPRIQKKAALTITPSAVKRLRQLVEGPDPKLIRVAVKNKGCAGLSYDLELTKEKGKFDEVVTQEEMDYVEDKLSSKFVFNNPNVKESCGCGESFLI
ncbi:21389_t:CDS:2 [Entrophospora sp. SA101]|nr:10529_t:CDS:2 [Entrophospora sp. SA101]CAJ0651910.1 8485_t:CDS:2 [Entrophospora sp. SA101]CAJ0747158.1 21389_t:CDS:2 [Entrophospora sp. SA101]CAJ0875671.1 22485_t:CDS:2 [Entrophospora sp. SA101]CAJ0880356.1 2381_t:CDS:2 [Entrophospora sp. SA101]